MPYGEAYKLVTVSGLVTLPMATWFFAQSMKLRFPGPAIVALATVPFIAGACSSSDSPGGDLTAGMGGSYVITPPPANALSGWPSALSGIAKTTHSSRM